MKMQTREIAFTVKNAEWMMSAVVFCWGLLKKLKQKGGNLSNREIHKTKTKELKMSCPIKTHTRESGEQKKKA